MLIIVDFGYCLAKLILTLWEDLRLLEFLTMFSRKRAKRSLAADLSAIRGSGQKSTPKFRRTPKAGTQSKEKEIGKWKQDR